MKNISVMIVEDDPIVSFLHKKILQKNKIAQNPLTFMNGKDAWDFLINDTSNKYFLILLDLNMPILNGWQFLDRLEEDDDISHRTKVAIVTSSINPSDINKAKKYGVVEHYLSKPLLEVAEIYRLIDSLNKLQINQQ